MRSVQLSIFLDRMQFSYVFNIHCLPMKKFFAYIFFCCILVTGNAQLVTEIKTANSFSLSNAVIYVDDDDDALVKKSAELLQQDIEMVTGKKPAIS